MTVVIGTAGHIDHGKTALLRALTGIDADRLPEEQRRGLTIDIGYAHFSPDGGPEVDFVDVPGHDRLVGNMLVGVGEIDAALLVVAADDGPRAQTWEHLGLLDAMRIGHGIVVVTKTDLVDDARVGTVVAQLRRHLAITTLTEAAIVAASATTGEGLDSLRARLAALRDQVLRDQVLRDPALRDPAPGTRPAGSEARVWLAIDRAFSVRGHGAVVTGSSRGASMGHGDRLLLQPGALRLRVRRVQVHDATVERAPERGRVALNVSGAGPDALRRGQLLTSGSTMGPLSAAVSDRLLVALRPPAALPGRRADDPWPPPDGARLRLHIGTDRVDTTVGRSGRDAVLLPDGDAIAMLNLARPVATAVGELFVLRRPPPAGLLAGGTVLDAAPPRGRARRRQTPATLARLAASVDAGSSGAISDALLGLHGSLHLPDWARLAPDVAAAVGKALTESVASFHAEHPDRTGMPLASARAVGLDVLKRRIGTRHRDGAPLVDAAIEMLISAGRLVREGEDVRLSQHRPARRDPEAERAKARLVALLDVDAPAPLEAAAGEAGCSADGIRELERDGVIVVVDDDLAWSAGTWERLRDLALGLAEARPLTPATLRDATGTSRKYVMALLEDLDRRGILRRTSAGHVRGPRA